MVGDIATFEKRICVNKNKVPTMHTNNNNEFDLQHNKKIISSSFLYLNSIYNILEMMLSKKSMVVKISSIIAHDQRNGVDSIQMSLQ